MFGCFGGHNFGNGISILPKHSRILAISGGIGSGKSSVVSYLAERGLPHLDMDQVSRDISQKGSETLQQLCQVFSADILTNNDELDRKKLADICFQSPSKTAQLNRIMHPFIWDEVQKWQVQQNKPWVVLEIPLLIESNSLERVDFIVMLITDILLRKQRVLARGFQNEELFERIVQRQCHDKERQKVANFIIQNNHKDQMHAQCEQLLARLAVQ